MKFDFSIIIATLGRPSLYKLLDCIESSSVSPTTVFLSLPKNSNFQLKYDDYSFEITIIKIAYGQVAQRYAAYPLIKSPLTIQFDDDICFETDFLSSLISRFLNLPFNSILAPALYDSDSLRSTLVYPKPFLSALLYFIASLKFVPPFGSPTRCGYPIGFSLLQPRYLDTNMIPVDWCPGACIIHHTSNLLSYNYFKLDGKAYAEDLVHCMCLSKHNINTFIDPTLRVNTFDSSTISSNSIADFVRSRFSLYNSLKIHNVPFNTFLFCLFTFFYCISRFSSLIIKRIND